MDNKSCLIYEGEKFTLEWYYDTNGIYAFKPQPDRYLSFFTDEKKIIVTNGFRKKTEKLPKNEKTWPLNSGKIILKERTEEKNNEVNLRRIYQ